MPTTLREIADRQAEWVGRGFPAEAIGAVPVPSPPPAALPPGSVPNVRIVEPCPGAIFLLASVGECPVAAVALDLSTAARLADDLAAFVARKIFELSQGE